MYELGRPILSSHLLTQKNPQFQLCFLGRVIVCTGKQAVQPWLSACPGAEKGGHGEALLAGLRSEPLSAQSSIASRHSAVPAPVNTHSSAQAERCSVKGDHRQKLRAQQAARALGARREPSRRAALS